jgi:cobalt/nickel transport system permease protein
MTFDDKFFNIGQIDRLSYSETCIHRLDPRVKVIATLLFLLTVISFPKYDLAALMPLFLFPALFMALGDIPFGFIAWKVIAVSPFALFVGVFNPILDTRIMTVVFGMPVSAGFISFLSILLKFTLTVSTALLLIATTSFPGVCHALRRMGVPSIFVSQLLFLYRYLFVLMEEALRINRAREMRSFGRDGLGVRLFIRIVGILFVRTLDRAERIYYAMLSRGFQGDMPTLIKGRIGLADGVFLAATVIFLFIFRLYPVTEGIGRFLEALIR